MNSYTYGTLPPAQEIIEGCSREYFTITRIGHYPSLIPAINQGIDSHLEAVFFNLDGDTIHIERQSIPTLLRRLMEMYEQGYNESAELAESILSTLNIEWV